MPAKTEREKAQRTIAENRKARHDYHILDTWEAGIALLGTEVKSIREGSVNLRDSYARVDRGEIWLLNLHIGPYSHMGYASHEEYIVHVLEKEIAQFEGAQSDADITEKLRGLGYIS